MKRILLTLTASAIAALFAAVGTAAAGTNTSNTHFDIPCASSGQVCDQPIQETATTTSKLLLEFQSWDSCSNFSVAFVVDGTLMYTSAVLAKFDTTGEIDVGPVAAGAHVLEVRATGVPTGTCNTGTLTSWSGRFLITTNDDPVPPPPTDEEEEPDPGAVTPPDEGTDPEPEGAPIPSGPTTKAECKDGGWKNFSEPTFKNQGECVNWAERQEREPKSKPEKPPAKNAKPSKPTQPSTPGDRRDPNGKKTGQHGDWR